MSKEGETLRVLILEDDPTISMALEAVVEDAVSAVILVRPSVASAEQVLDQHFDMALLDIELTNGETYNIARALDSKAVPFAFVSGNSREQIPEEFRRFPLIAKPFRAEEIEQAILLATRRGKPSRRRP